MAKKKKVDLPPVATELDLLVSRLRLQERARDVLAKEKADRLFSEPPSDWSLSELLAKDRKPLEYTIGELHPCGASSLIAAQYKVGKTTLMMNLAQAYADGTDFLGVFPVKPGGGRIAIFNYELTEDMFLDLYVKPMYIDNPDKIAVLNLRGSNFDLRSPTAFRFAVKWLKERDCDALIVDPYGAAARLGNGNDNSEAHNWLLEYVDPLKAEAGIQDLWMPAHTGRGEAEEGSEHVRGASSVDDWADVRWLYTKQRENGGNWQRYLSANGRGVDVPSWRIDFDSEDNMLMGVKQSSRAQARSKDAAAEAVRVARESPGIGSTDLRNSMSGDTKDKAAGIKSAVDKGWLEVKQDGRSKKHYSTDAGCAALGLK